MGKISIYVKDSVETRLKAEALKNEQSLSEYTAELIDLGLKIKSMQHDEAKQKKAELEEKHTEFIMRILNISAEILRCVYDEDKMKNKTGSAQGALERIDEKVKNYIDQYIGIKTDID